MKRAVRGLLVSVAAAGIAVQPCFATARSTAHQPIPLFPALPVARPEAPIVLGRTEHVTIISNPPLTVTANLDPDVAHSTLYVVAMKYFVHDGDTWVDFNVDNGMVLSNSRIELQRQILKDEHVHDRGGGYSHRPWVSMDFCIGKRKFKTTLALEDRNAYTAVLRIGAPDIHSLGSVDPSVQFTAEPDCAPPAPAASSSVAPQ